MKDFYDLSKMKRVPHPMQARIDNGEIKLKSHFDISEEEFQGKLKLLDKEQRKIILKMRQQWKEKKILQDISQVEISYSTQLPSEVINLLGEIKTHLSSISSVGVK